jgi:hypothetical protein
VPTYLVVMRGPNPLDAKPIIASEDPTVVASALAAIKRELVLGDGSGPDALPSAEGERVRAERSTPRGSQSRGSQ